MIAAGRTDPSGATGDWRPWLFALLAAGLAMAGGLTIEHFQAQSLRQHERSDVISKLAEQRVRLEAIINGNLLATQGLTAFIAAHPDIDQASFARIARGLITRERPLRNIAAARDLLISLIYPVEGNEAAIGLDYRHVPGQREAVMRAVESGETVIAGPLELVQGGIGLIARQPVYLAPDSADGPPQLWGLVSTVVDVQQLYRLAGLPSDGRSGDLNIAIRGKDGKGELGEIFYGDPGLFEREPVTVTVELPGGSWQMAAMPAAGWAQDEAYRSQLRRTWLVAIAVALAVGVVAYLMARSIQNLHRASAALAESQALFSGFLDNLPAGAYVLDPDDGRTLLDNRWLRENLPGHANAGGAWAAEDLAALFGGPQRRVLQLNDSRGQPVHCDTQRFLLEAPKGRLVGGIVMDVTDRVEAQNKLAASRARLRAVLDTIPDLVWLKDADGVYLACNPRFEALFGAKEAEIVGKRGVDFVDPTQAAQFRANDLAAIAAGRPTSNEEMVTFASDGHEELLETTKSPLYDEEGKPIGVLGIARDITQRRLAEDQLRASTRRLEAAERIAHVGNWDYRLGDGRISWSDETYRLFALLPQERQIDLEWLHSRVHEDDRERFDDYLQDLLASRPGEPISEFRFRIRRPEGELRSLSSSVTIEFGDDGRPTRIFGTLQDVTEQEHLQRDLQARLEELTRWQAVMLGREDRVAELKREVNQLLTAQGRGVRYPSQEGAP